MPDHLMLHNKSNAKIQQESLAYCTLLSIKSYEYDMIGCNLCILLQHPKSWNQLLLLGPWTSIRLEYAIPPCAGALLSVTKIWVLVNLLMGIFIA